MSEQFHILCFGNSLHGDDGFGPAVCERLRRQPLPANVRLFEGGTRSLDALGLFENCTRVILVDAMAGSVPGRLNRLAPAEVAREPLVAGGHGAGIGQLLAAVAALMPDPPRIEIYAAEIGEFKPFLLQLSAPISAAVDIAVGWILQAIEDNERERL